MWSIQLDKNEGKVIIDGVEYKEDKNNDKTINQAIKNNEIKNIKLVIVTGKQIGRAHV